MTAYRNLTRRNAAILVAAAAGLTAGAATLNTEGSRAQARQPSATSEVRILLAATSGRHLAETRATGRDALLINAAMPFASDAIAAARPFDLSQRDRVTDYRRALLCLTQAIYYEAGYEPVDGRRAVAQVVINRMRHPAFPKSVCGVVYQGASDPVCQFSFVCDGSLYRRPEQGAWKQAEAIARAALDGFVERAVGGATHYHANYVAPYWAPRLAKLAQIGAHIFYRWPGSWGMPAAFSGRYIGEPQDPLTLRPPPRDADAAETVEGEEVTVEGPITDGTDLSRAPNDVGGLLDTSRGWTLTIPMPGDVEDTAAGSLPAQKASGGTVTAAAAPVAGEPVAGL